MLADLLGPHAGIRYCFPIPGIKPENSVGFGDSVPTLEIAESLAFRFPDADELRFQPRFEFAKLQIGE